MPGIHYIPSEPKDPEEFLLMAAWALKNRDRFEANTVMDLAQQAITAYIGDSTQQKASDHANLLVTTCGICGRKTLDPVRIKLPNGSILPHCNKCAEDYIKKLSPANKASKPEGGVRQG